MSLSCIRRVHFDVTVATRACPTHVVSLSNKSKNNWQKVIASSTTRMIHLQFNYWNTALKQLYHRATWILQKLTSLKKIMKTNWMSITTRFSTSTAIAKNCRQITYQATNSCFNVRTVKTGFITIICFHQFYVIQAKLMTMFLCVETVLLELIYWLNEIKCGQMYET